MSELSLLESRGYRPYSYGHRMMYEAPVRMFSDVPSSVIDVGCGIGYGYQVLVREKAVSRYLGVEIDEGTAEYARKLLVDSRHEVLCDDWLRVPEQLLFVADFVFCIEVIEHVVEARRKAFVERCARSFRKASFFSTPPKERQKHGALTVRECLALLRSAGMQAVAINAQWTTLYVCGKK